MSGTGLLLAPGAGANRDQAALVAIDEAVSAAGVRVVRMDFPYRKAGRRAPDRAPVLVAAVVEETERLASEVDRVVLGGRSMGGRMCSIAVAEGLPAAGLVLVSYPLHPPGRPERMRTEHLPGIEVPCLMVSGTRDAFGRVDELEAAAALIPGSVVTSWIEGGDHGLRRRDALVAGIVAEWIVSLG